MHLVLEITRTAFISWKRFLLSSFFMMILIFLLVLQSLPKADSYFYANNCEPGKDCVTLGIIYPHSTFLNRQYQKSIKQGFESVRKQNFSFMAHVYITNVSQRMESNPSPTAILKTLCSEFLPNNVSAIVLLTSIQTFGRSTASWQYFLQLAGYLGIPVIAWNADNSGLEQAAQNAFNIQLAPSVHHQAEAMLSILYRYKWRSFSIVTSQIAGHSDFVQAIRAQVAKYGDNPQGNRFVIIDTIIARDVPESLKLLAASESRVMLLYSTQEEAKVILREATKLDLTGANYIWIATQSVIAASFEESLPVNENFPVGMLGVNFDSSTDTLHLNLAASIAIFAQGVELFLKDSNRYLSSDLNPKLSCYDRNNSEWRNGGKFYRKLKNVTLSQLPHDLSFDENGKRNDVELKIVNLRDGTGNSKIWEEIGVWRSWEENGLSVNDIVWPGNEHVPPPGVPEKFHVKIVFLDEPPYINLASADPITNECSANRGLPCKVPIVVNASKNGNPLNDSSENMCCSGFCIDLLKLFADDLRFSYDLVKVADGNWGTLGPNNKWNGLIGELQRRDGDAPEMILTNFKINNDRETAVDFTVPFLESGITILVAKRTGIISPTAFLEPFDTASWMLVAFVAIQVAAFTIFLFEWLSPAGYNMKSGRAVIQEYDQSAPPRDHKFSLSRTYWLVWAVLFQAAVHVDCPKGFTARFMANMWAMFAVVFLAIYTANLAAFMITREEYHDFSGLNDSRLRIPSSVTPPLKLGTVVETNSASVLKKHHDTIWNFMKRKGYLKVNVSEGIKAIKEKKLDGFIYDATVLDYLVGQDDDCQILTVGSWYAMSGYGIAFPRGSKYLPQFNRKLMEYKESGEIERLQRFWLTGTCKPKMQQRRASEPLAIEQFLSAYLLLACGIGLAIILLCLEHIYFLYFRKHLAKHDSGGCCALVSLSMGKSLTFRGAVYEAQNQLRRHRCRDPICDSHLWTVKEELLTANKRLKELQKQIDTRDPMQGEIIIDPTKRKTSSSLDDIPVMSSQQPLTVSHPTLRRHDLTRNLISFTKSPALQLQEQQQFQTLQQQQQLQTLQQQQLQTLQQHQQLQSLQQQQQQSLQQQQQQVKSLQQQKQFESIHQLQILQQQQQQYLAFQQQEPILMIQQQPLQIMHQQNVAPSVVHKSLGRLRGMRPPLERRHSFENRSPDSPLEGLLRCQNQMK